MQKYQWRRTTGEEERAAEVATRRTMDQIRVRDRDMVGVLIGQPHFQKGSEGQ
jgi:hypothetical protein